MKAIDREISDSSVTLEGRPGCGQECAASPLGSFSLRFIYCTHSGPSTFAKFPLRKSDLIPAGRVQEVPHIHRDLSSN